MIKNSTANTGLNNDKTNRGLRTYHFTGHGETVPVNSGVL